MSKEFHFYSSSPQKDKYPYLYVFDREGKNYSVLYRNALIKLREYDFHPGQWWKLIIDKNIQQLAKENFFLHIPTYEDLLLHILKYNLILVQPRDAEKDRIHNFDVNKIREYFDYEN